MSRLQNYFNELNKNFNYYHSNLLKNTTKEDIHKMRTTLKKLKTFNILLDGLLFRQKDFPSELQLLFKSCGKIRDIQIQQKILEDYDDEYVDYLQEKYQNRLLRFKIKKDFSEQLKYISDKLDKVEDYHINEQIEKNVQSYIELGYNEIKNMIDDASIDNLHEIRILLKRLYYTHLMLEESEEVDKLDNIQETIGLWHDYDVTIQNIKKFENNSSIIKPLRKKRDLLYNESLELLKTI